MARVAKWIGLSAADTGTRLAAQMISTAILARMLTPEQFGIALMVLSVVVVLGTFVSTPLEEALAQRRRLVTGHLQSALFVSGLASIAAIGVIAALAPLLARLSGVEALSIWLPVGALFLLGQGPGCVARAVWRRQRNFGDIALCQAGSVVIACIAAIAVAFAGMGILALIVQRMLPIVLYPLLAMLAFGYRGRTALIRPRWDGPRFREIFGFSRLRLADEILRAMMPALLTFMVNSWFGTAVLGQLSIAMRLVEPLRSAVVSVGHNLVFALLAPLQDDPRRLGQASAQVVANVASVAVPAFLGIAVCAPILLPLIVGPGWDGAASLSRALCVAAAVSVPFRYFYSGFSALGRPHYNIMGSALGLVVAAAGIWAAALWGSVAGVSFAMILTDLAMAGLATTLILPLAGRAIWPPLMLVLRIWLAATLMVVALDRLWLKGGLIPHGPLLLIPMIVSGVLLYGALLWLLCNPAFQMLQSTFLRRKRG